MKHHFKKKQLYFFIDTAYPENIFLKKKPLSSQKRLLPNFQKKLKLSIKHLQKKLFLKMDRIPTEENKKEMECRVFIEKSLRNEKKHDSEKQNLKNITRYSNPPFFLAKNQEAYPLFTRGQGTSNVNMPFSVFRKVSHYYTRLVEKKKFCILYGVTNQKKLYERIRHGGKLSLTLCERKIDVLSLKTGLFQNIPITQTEINHKRICLNGQTVLSFSVQAEPGDAFSIKTKIKKSSIEEIYARLKKRIKRMTYAFLVSPKFFQQKKVYLLLKKMLFYINSRAFSKKVLHQKGRQWKPRGSRKKGFPAFKNRKYFPFRREESRPFRGKRKTHTPYKRDLIH